jgi:hypothetical protein
MSNCQLSRLKCPSTKSKLIFPVLSACYYIYVRSPEESFQKETNLFLMKSKRGSSYK